MTYYAALDVGVRDLALCIINDSGEVRLEPGLTAGLAIFWLSIPAIKSGAAAGS